MKTYKIVIPGELPTLNEMISAGKAQDNSQTAARRGSRRVNMAYKAIADKTKKKIAQYLLLQMRGHKMTGNYMAVFLWYRKNKKFDPSNINAGSKFILDAMQDYGCIQNDGWDQFGYGILNYHFVDKKDPRTVVYFVENDTFPVSIEALESSAVNKFTKKLGGLL